MADEENKTDAEAAPAGASAAPEQVEAGVIAQYVKDLSFENPNAPVALQQMGNAKPAIDVNVNVNAQKLNDEVFEVALTVSANAKYDDNSAFVVELVYAGLFGLRNFPEEHLEPFMLITAPNMLFPFARRVVADATRDGGYPPLMLEPLNFEALYRQQLEQRQAQGAPNGDAAAAAEPQIIN